MKTTLKNSISKLLKSFGVRTKALILLLLCVSQIALGQCYILGKMETFCDINMSAQARSMAIKADIGNPVFHSEVGGLAFEGIAKPAKNIIGQTVSVDYMNNQFVVTVGNQNFYPELPKWQLVPISNFADDEYQSVFTIFGKETVNGQNVKCLYHKAFVDELLGLRMFQADLVWMYADAVFELPKDNNGKYLLGDNETPPQSINYGNQSDIDRYNKYVALSQSRPEATSYVLTDKNVDIVFNTTNDKFTLTGTPYYFFTHTSVDAKKAAELDAKIDNVYKEIEMYAKSVLKEKYSNKINIRTNPNAFNNALNNKIIELNNDISAGKTIPAGMYQAVNNLNNAIERNNSLIKQRENCMKFYTLDSYTNSMKQHWSFLKECNPALFGAIENTVRWAAFFRYVKENNQENWENFIEKINTIIIDDAPAVTTPIDYKYHE
ncbi:hypothetical protein FACS1894178_2720 [Bacteroidia bacterium]|nr:hypothetical protein FACS1894178_2720 [Bacteroidia bacterium]